MGTFWWFGIVVSKAQWEAGTWFLFVFFSSDFVVNIAIEGSHNRTAKVIALQ